MTAPAEITKRTNMETGKKETALAVQQVASIGGSVPSLRQATDVAHVCRDIVLATAVEIEKRRYVRVEGWMAIAVAHGCIATIKSVEETDHGVRAVAEIRRQSDGQLLTSAEGYVGRDEPDWFGGEVERWDRKTNQYVKKTLSKRSDFAIRSMAQTRATSRACRTAFSHVIVLMDAGLETTPAEEAGTGTIEADDTGTQAHAHAPAHAPAAATPPPAAASAERQPEVPRDETIAQREKFRGGKWHEVTIHFGKDKGAKLGDLPPKKLHWWLSEWQPKPFGNRPLNPDDVNLRAALDVAAEETPNE